MRRDAIESIRLDEVDLAYRIAGDGPELVVLLYGWPQTSACWRHVAAPILTLDGRVRAALGIVAHSRAAVDRLAPAVRTAALGIARATS
jgi:pimeloyl-ACP methyl ester carboxylesterase